MGKFTIRIYGKLAAPVIKERKGVEVQSLLDECYAAPGPVQQEAE
jgi:hypothetical protein